MPDSPDGLDAAGQALEAFDSSDSQPQRTLAASWPAQVQDTSPAEKSSSGRGHGSHAESQGIADVSSAAGVRLCRG